MQGYKERPPELREAISEGWAWLEGQALLIADPTNRGSTVQRVLSRTGKRIAASSDLQKAFLNASLSKAAIHQSIRNDVWALFHRGDYETAVFKAMKAVEVSVRQTAKLDQTDLGVPLMRKAFDAKNGPLTDTTVEFGEREARAHFFAGAIGAYKNPHSHRNVPLTDPTEAAEIIMLASHLLRIVQTRRELND